MFPDFVRLNPVRLEYHHDRKAYSIVLFNSYSAGRGENHPFLFSMANAQDIPCPPDFRLIIPRPVLLYFWSDRCTQCKTQEREISAAQNILRQFGKQFDIRKINALEDRKTAELYRVMTVPTVILLDEDEQPVAVHPGFTRAKTISEQYLRSA